MFRPDYNGATALLSKALSTRNISVPSGDALIEAVLDYFEDNDFYLAAAILGKVTIQQDWHFVEVGKDTPFNRSMDTINVSDSLASAIGSVIAEIDSEHFYPDAIKVHGKAIEFHSNGKLMFRIGKIEYTDVDKAMSDRCAKLFKGVKRYGDEARISKRLQSIPQLESIDCDDFKKNTRARGSSMIAMVENFPVFLREMLSERFGIDIKQSMALDIVAEMFGAKSWHVIKSSADAMTTVFSPVVVEISNEQDSLVSYYRSNSDAIIGFTNELRNHPDKEQLKVVFHGGGISFKSAYISAHNPAFDKDDGYLTMHTDVIYMSAPSEVGINESDLSLLSWINDSDFHSIVSKLNELMLVNSPLMSRLTASSERSNNKILPIKNYLFTLIKHDSVNSILKVERFTEDGSKIDKSHMAAFAAAYKAELSFTREGVLLTGDYGHDKVAMLDGFNEADILRLSKFSNIAIRPIMTVPEELIH